MYILYKNSAEMYQTLTTKKIETLPKFLVESFLENS